MMRSGIEATSSVHSLGRKEAQTSKGKSPQTLKMVAINNKNLDLPEGPSSVFGIASPSSISF